MLLTTLTAFLAQPRAALYRPTSSVAMSETPTPAEPEVSEEDGVEVKTPTYTPIFVTLSRESAALKSEIANIQKQEYVFGINIGATDDGRQVISKISGETAKTLLRVGDEVMAIDDAPVSPTFSHPDLAAVLTHEGLMERIAAATTIKLTILREDADDEEEEVVPVCTPKPRRVALACPHLPRSAGRRSERDRCVTPLPTSQRSSIARPTCAAA